MRPCRRPRNWGAPAGKSVKEFAVQVVELAFVRDRIDRGLADQRTYQLHAEEAYWLTATRAQAVSSSDTALSGNCRAGR